VRQVEEVDIGLHITASEQFNTEGLSVNFLIELETAFVVVGHVATASLICGTAGFTGILFRAVLLEHSLLGLLNDLVFLLSLGFLYDMADARMRVEYWLKFHTLILK
jgi:hypothetical protein